MKKREFTHNDGSSYAAQERAALESMRASRRRLRAAGVIVWEHEDMIEVSCSREQLEALMGPSSGGEQPGGVLPPPRGDLK